MGIPYDFYANPPRKGSSRTPKLHARVKPYGTADTADIEELIQQFTSLSTADTKAALDAFVNVMVMKLSTGYAVHLKGLGYFSLTLSCPPVTSLHEIRMESIRIKSLAFRPDAPMKDRLNSLKADLIRAEHKNHSFAYSAIEIDHLLTGHFMDNPHIASRQFCRLCGMTLITGRRRLRQLVAEGKLRKIGHANFPLYVPVEGNYRK